MGDVQKVEYERVQEAAERQLGSVHSLSMSLLKKLRSAERQTEVLLEENHALEEKNADLVSQLTAMGEKAKLLVEKEDSLSRLAVELNLAKKEVLAARHDAKKSAAEKEALDAEKDALLAEKDTLQSQVATLHVQIDGLNSEVADAKEATEKEKESRAKDVEEREEKLRGVEQERDKASKAEGHALEALAAKEKALEELTEQMTREVSVAEEKADGAEKEAKRMEEEIVSIKKEIDEVKAQKSGLDEEVTNLKENKADLEGQMDNLRTDSDQLSIALGNAEKERDELNADIQEKDNQLASLSADYASVKNDRDTLQGDVNARAAKITKLRSLLVEVDDEMKEGGQKEAPEEAVRALPADEAEKGPETTSRDVGAVGEAVATLAVDTPAEEDEDEVDFLAAKISALKGERDSLQKELQERTAAVDDLASKVSAVSSERDSLNTKLSEVESELNETKEKLEKSKSDIEELSKEISMVESDRDALAELKIQLEKSIAESLSRVEELDAEKEALQKKVEQLTETERMLGLALKSANDEKEEMIVNHKKALKKLSDDKDRQFDLRTEELKKELDSVLRKDVDQVVDRYSVSSSFSGPDKVPPPDEGDTTAAESAAPVMSRGGVGAPPLEVTEVSGEPLPTHVGAPVPGDDSGLATEQGAGFERVYESAKGSIYPGVQLKEGAVVDEEAIEEEEGVAAIRQVPSLEEAMEAAPHAGTAVQTPSREAEVGRVGGVSPVTPAGEVKVDTEAEAPATAIFGEKESKDLESIVEDEAFRGQRSTESGGGLAVASSFEEGDATGIMKGAGASGEVVRETLIDEVVEDSRDNVGAIVNTGDDVVEEVDEEVMVPAEEAEQRRKAAGDAARVEEPKDLKITSVSAPEKETKPDTDVSTTRTAQGVAQQTSTAAPASVASGATRTGARAADSDAKSQSKISGLFRNCCGAPEPQSQ